MIPKIKKIYIRKMTFDDARTVEEIEKDSFSDPWSERSIKNGIIKQDNYFIVAEKNDTILGYAGMYFVLTEGYMYNIAVKRVYRNQGIGGMLLDSLLMHCKRAKLDFLSLEVRCSNISAIKLYENKGFSQIGKRKHFYKSPEEDALIMTKYFK